MEKQLKKNPSLHLLYKDVDPFVLEKWERAFKGFFDTNANTSLDSADFYVVNRHVRDIYGAESVQVKFAKDSLQALWKGLLALADRNKDKMIQLEEWIAVLKSCDRAHEPQWFHDYFMFLFKLFDVSADDKIDLAEYTDGMAAYGYNEKEAHEAFKIIAVNTAGSPIPALDMSQFKKLWLDYFFSTDKAARGNHLFGKLDIE